VSFFTVTRRTPNCRRLLSGLRLLFLLLTTLGAAAQPKRVLIVHSFGSAAPPFTTASTAFETALTEEMGEGVDLDEVSLDVARYATLEMEEALIELMRKRQARWQPDLVVPIGSPAGVFVAQYRDRLFPARTPIIYTGMDQRRLPPGALQQNATFLGASYDLPGAVEDILQVAPATTNIVVVIGATPLEQFWTDVLRREYQPFTNRVSFTWFNDLSFDQMLQRSAKLPPRSFMLLILLMRDAAGVTHNADEALRRIHEIANAPVNGLFKNQLGMGIVGGRLYADDFEGMESARIAVRILRGEPASSFPPRVVPPSGPQYDWRELQRWNISEDRLPAGSVILFRQPGFWERYLWPIAVTFWFIIFQTVLIAGLAINRARRRQGEREATLIADVSSKFVNLPPGEVDHEILDAQRRIFELLDLDVSGFWQWSAEASGFFRLTHHSRAGEGPQIPERMNSQEYFPWYQQQVLAGRTIAVRSMTELPPEAARDRETFRQFGFKSNLTIPLSVGGEPPIGALGFNTTRAERDWPDALIKRLQLVAQIFTNALARKRADQALRESQERITLAAEAAQLGLWTWDVSGNSVWLTDNLRELLGYSATEKVTYENFLMRVHEEDRTTVAQAVQGALAQGGRYHREYRVVLPDGALRWFAMSGRVKANSTGTPVQMLGVFIDATERHRADEESRELSGKLLTAQEDERKRIARELHDDLNQRLALLCVEMEIFGTLSEDTRGLARERLDSMTSQVKGLSSEVHRLAYQLHPAKLDQLGLVVAARTFCRETSLQAGIVVHFEQHDVPRDVGANVALCLYRVIQEAVQNSVRHNSGAAVQVSLIRAGEQIRLLITDEGKGFDVDHAMHNGGLGLVSMRERVRQVNGTIQFTSSPGKGTRIEVNVPLLHQAPAG
jgi:PAS domain S-box-containing protein